VLHRRTLSLEAELGVLTIYDEIVANGTHEIAIYFHLAEDTIVSAAQPNEYRIDVAGGTVALEIDPRLTVETLRGSEDPIGGWVSRGYHRKAPSTTLMARGRCEGASSFVSRVQRWCAPSIVPTRPATAG
jgi:hypothetical protein